MRSKIVFVVLCLSLAFFAQGQINGQQLGQQLGEMTNLIAEDAKQAKANKLKNQTSSLEHSNNALQGLSSGNYSIALSQSAAATISYPKYSVPYFISAFAALQLNDTLLACRKMNYYDRFAKKRINRKLDKNAIPAELVNGTRKEIKDAFHMLDPIRMKQQFRREPWLKHSLLLSINPNMLVNSYYDEYNFYDHDFFPEYSDFLFDGNIGLTWSMNFWAKKKRMPEYGKQVGFQVNVGGSYNVTSNTDFFPSSYKIFITPGVFFGKFYFSPGQLRYRQITGAQYSPVYNEEIAEDYPFVFGKYNQFAFTISPELRFYPGVINAFAVDARKSKYSQYSKGVSYLYVKFADDYLSGEDSNGFYYGQNRRDLFAGFSASPEKRNIEMKMLFGFSWNYVENVASDLRQVDAFANYWIIGLEAFIRIL